VLSRRESFAEEYALRGATENDRQDESSAKLSASA